MANLPRWSVDVTDPASPSVTLNGHGRPLPGVTRVLVEAVPNNLARLVVEVRGVVDVEGMGGVALNVPEQDPAELVAAFLGEIDPSELERAAANRGGDFAAPESLGQSFLAVLRGWASGRPDQP